jgi:hypothetical protein
VPQPFFVICFWWWNSNRLSFGRISWQERLARQQIEKVLDSYCSLCFDLWFVCPFGGYFVQKLNGSNECDECAPWSLDRFIASVEHFMRLQWPTRKSASRSSVFLERDHNQSKRSLICCTDAPYFTMQSHIDQPLREYIYGVSLIRPAQDIVVTSGKAKKKYRSGIFVGRGALPRDRRRSADAELWRPCWPDVARGNGGEVGSLALPRLAWPAGVQEATSQQEGSGVRSRARSNTRTTSPRARINHARLALINGSR